MLERCQRWPIARTMELSTDTVVQSTRLSDTNLAPIMFCTGRLEPPVKCPPVRQRIQSTCSHHLSVVGQIGRKIVVQAVVGRYPQPYSYNKAPQHCSSRVDIRPSPFVIMIHTQKQQNQSDAKFLIVWILIVSCGGFFWSTFGNDISKK
jgi:hypothetical protein